MNEYDRAIYSPEDIPASIRKGLNPLDPGIPEYNYAEALELGWEWFFEKTAKHQPKTYSVIKSLTPKIFVAEEIYHDRVDSRKTYWRGQPFLCLNESCIALYLGSSYGNIETRGSKDPCYDRFSSLPESIAKGYYWRMWGMQYLTELPVNPFSCYGLPIDITSWPGIESVTTENRKKVKAQIVGQLRKIYEERGERLSDAKFFRVFMRTVPGDTGNYHSLLINERSSSKDVFLIQDCDPDSLSLLNNPEEFVDDYVSQLLAEETNGSDEH